MRPTRPGPALVTAAVMAMLLAACTSGTVRSGTGKAGPAVASGLTSTRPDGRSTTSATPAGESVLVCSSGVAVSDAQAAPLQVVLGVVALPASPGYPALQTSLSGNGPRRLFAKTGLVIRAGTTFELIVPARFTSRLSIGWDTPSHRVVVDSCASPGGGRWLIYVGGYWIDRPACVPLIVRAGSRQQQVHIGLGTACPGQRPPQGPSQS